MSEEKDMTPIEKARAAKEANKAEKEALERKIIEQEAELMALRAQVGTKASVEVMDSAPLIDPTQISHYEAAMDPWMGANIEPGWHHVKVTEHAPALGLPSNKLKFLRMGYQIAPAPDEVRANWDEAKSWVMRLPQAVRDARVAESRRKSREQRDASLQAPEGSDMIVTRSEQIKTSLADHGISVANG